MLRGAVIAATVVGLACGCGGGGEHYELGAFRSCADDAPGVTIDDDATLDYLAEDASGGAVALSVTGTVVTVAFGRTENDAKRMASTYKLFAEAFETPIDDILYRRGNTVVIWDETPTERDRDRLDACLS
jgi:hypothetical protein